MLELLIVLAIMVGVAALSFPRLTRPLAESDAHRAANHLRDAITECRQSAALGGQPLFMRLESQQSQVEWGGWTELLAGEFDDARQGWQPQQETVTPATDRSDSGIPANQTALKSAALPAGVVIESVRWISDVSASDGVSETASDQRDSATASGAVIDPSNEALPEPFESTDEPVAGADTPSDSIEGERWYLPFLPSGRTRDCVIVLHDPTSGARVRLELDSVTGMMRVTR